MSNYIKTANSLIVFHDNRVHNVAVGSRAYGAALKAIENDDYDTAIQTIDKMAIIDTVYSNQADFYIENGVCYFRDEPLAPGLSRRLIDMARANAPLEPMLRFLRRLSGNPSNRSSTQLLDFLDKNSLPITEDGYFLAYKKITDNWKDCYSGRIDNSVGAVVSMPRNMVDDDPANTCSHGLHVASKAYLQHFYGERLILVKIDPADVVAVPLDYENSKMRVCRYVVLKEIDEPEERAVVTDTEGNDAYVRDDESEESEESAQYIIRHRDIGSLFLEEIDEGRWTEIRDNAFVFGSYGEASAECPVTGIVIPL